MALWSFEERMWYFLVSLLWILFRERGGCLLKFCASVSLVLWIWKQNSCVSHWGGISKPLNSFCLLIIKVIFHLSGSDFSICSTEENRLDCCQHHFFFFLLWLQWLICFLSFLFFQYYKWVSSFLKLVLCLLCMAEESKADLSASPSPCHLETYTYSF